jgi:hypothetical protein
MESLKEQIGGNHYKNLKIQPIEYIHANGLGYFEGNVIKYTTRWKSKDGVSDLRKARHYLDLLIEMVAGPQVDAKDAPYGVKKDGTPKAKPGRRAGVKK